MLNWVKKGKLRRTSLRNRAIFFSVSVSLIIIIIFFVGYSNFKKFYEESSLHLNQRNDLIIKLSLIRSELLTSYKDLNSFLLTPENPGYQKNVITSISKAIELNKQLSQHPWISKYKREKAAVKLTENLALYKIDAAKLISVRQELSNQYPSLAVGAEVMQPNRNTLNNLIALAVNEATTENVQIHYPNVYQTLMQLRHLWGQVLSNFRLYLANRVGSFNKNALPNQEHAIEVMFKEMQGQILKLNDFSKEGKLGFETSESIVQISNSANDWFAGFKRVKVIHHSDEWRRDAKIMKDIISPRMDSIIYHLVKVENIFTDSSESDLEKYRLMSNTQSRILFFIVALGVLLILLLVISLDKLIFKPIALISEALKSEALGQKTVLKPMVRTKEIQGLLDAFKEMSQQVHVRQKELEFRALHDSLTSLPNRTLLLDRVSLEIKNAKRESQKLSLLVIDLDNFKEINDTLGHFTGDELLIEVGRRLIKTLRDTDTVARIGGDEFSILLPNTNEKQAKSAAKKIIASFKESINLADIDVVISSSIGITICPTHGEDVDTLLRHADIAMYTAKRHKLGFDVYDPDLDEHSVSQLSLNQDFREAMLNNKVTVNFQPIYDLKSNKIVALEALSRWEHPELGFISPETFISLAEKMSLINELTYWVLNKSIAYVSQWHKIDSNLIAAVNLSVFSFKDPDFIAEIKNALRRYHFPSNKLKLEITEGAMMENPLQVIELLTELHAMGIKLSVDDFGTGFSSMAYLKQLPVDELKIDKSFVISLDTDQSNVAIVRSTIDLAHNLGMMVVAEGVENQAVQELLGEYKCDMAQGYHLSRPMSSDETEALLQSKL